MRYVSLFSGIEAATVAWEPLGWEPMAFAEVEPFPCEVLKSHYPKVPNLGDVTKIDWRAFRNDYGRPDLLVGGSPCQSFSIAGGRESLDGESRLMFEWLRCADELRPRWVVWENVPGALSAKGMQGERGGAFQCLLRQLAQYGYGVCWRVLDAQFYGVAQRRRRVFLVGRLGDPESAAKVLIEPESLSGDTRSGREKRKAIAGAAGGGAQGASWTLKLRHTGSDNRGGGAGPLVQEDVSATLATSQDQTLFALKTANTKAHGPNYSAEGVSYTLDLSASSCVAFAQNSRGEVRVQGDGEVSGALAANEGMKQRTYLAFKYHQGAKAGSIGCELDNSPTLTSDEKCPAVCMADTQSNCAVDEELCGTLSSRSFKDAPVVGRMVVRRLTPVECERLQGFPDGYTDIGVKCIKQKGGGYKAVEVDETPDAPRYRALGNSFAVPVVRWIGERIQRLEQDNDRD